MRRSCGLIGVLLATLWAASSLASAPSEPPPPPVAVGSEPLVLGENWTVDRFQRTESFTPGARYRLSNRFGDLRIRSANAGDTLLFAAVQGFVDDAVTAEIDLHEVDGVVVLEVRLQRDGETLAPDEVGKRRVDLGLVVPGGGEVEVESGDGLVEVKGVHGPLSVRSVSGTVRVYARNGVDVRSDHGPVEIYYHPVEDLPPLDVTTATGDIRVELPAGFDRTVWAETSGLLATDFSLDMKKETGIPLKAARITLGEGGDALRLTSQIGMIAVLDQPRLTKAEPREPPGKEMK